ncbi:MAG: hypothetical protein ACM31G_07170 [Flavobacteriales bacterium]
MAYTKIPRKLKKKLKKLTLASHSNDYIKYRKLKLKNIRIRSFRNDEDGWRWLREFV